MSQTRATKLMKADKFYSVTEIKATMLQQHIQLGDKSISDCEEYSDESIVSPRFRMTQKSNFDAPPGDVSSVGDC